jgi:hypothetical protein
VALFSTVAVMSMCGETKYIPRKSTATIFRALSANPVSFSTGRRQAFAEVPLW